MDSVFDPYLFPLSLSPHLLLLSRRPKTLRIGIVLSHLLPFLCHSLLSFCSLACTRTLSCTVETVENLPVFRPLMSVFPTFPSACSVLCQPFLDECSSLALQWEKVRNSGRNLVGDILSASRAITSVCVPARALRSAE